MALGMIARDISPHDLGGLFGHFPIETDAGTSPTESVLDFREEYCSLGRVLSNFHRAGG